MQDLNRNRRGHVNHHLRPQKPPLRTTRSEHTPYPGEQLHANKRQDFKQTAAQAMGSAYEAARRATEPAQHGSRANAEAVRQGADVIADLTRQGA